MRASPSSVRRAPHDTLHSVETDQNGIDPFDDVHEASAPQAADGASLRREPAPSLQQNSHSANDAQTRGHARQSATATGAAHDAHAEAHEPLGPDDPLAPLPFNPYKGNRGVTRAWHAMKNSLAGFQVAIREESAFRQELTLAAILVPCGVIVPVDPVSRVLLLGSVLLVLIVELLNSSVEAAIDRISLERHELSRRAKDLGSAAVMVALGMCLMTWVLIVGPLLVHWIGAWL
jgi:diacylglycerol kinase (ATP)